MLYPGCPDVHQYTRDNGDVFQSFWYEGEFWLRWFKRGEVIHTDYFDDVNELLLEMLNIAPYKDWKNLELFSGGA